MHHGKNKDTKNSYVTGKTPFKWLMVVLPKALFRAQPKVYAGAFLKIVTNF